ncbi:MAG: GlsB/YeaQ/YmgE family stress response membrane protein [Candidatus Omnitrophica bacterium]|nr:GlsB/YeaQ/YmgE family stress response membrane protein [Candidatus Omnitrophota bacterium]
MTYATGYNIGFGIGYWSVVLLLGGIIGWLAAKIMTGRGFGLIGDVVVGVLGAVLGSWIAGIVGLSSSTFTGAMLVALFGAVVLVGLTRFIKRIAH